MRFAALVLALFLLFEPLYERERIHEQNPVLAVLFDNSETLILLAFSAAVPFLIAKLRGRDLLRQEPGLFLFVFRAGDTIRVRVLAFLEQLADG